jgi:Zn-dependent peptidase ImmA (M78 family)
VRRGFKAEAERTADRLRKELGLRPTDRLDPDALARHIGADIRCADELTTRAKLEELEELQAGAFSACTLTIGEKHVIIYSPLASVGRRSSDVCHEVAHIVLGHEVGEVEQIGNLVFFTCDPDEEQEANWLAGCLLLPRPLLLAAAKRGMAAPQIADVYGVSEQMAAFRLRTTGVEHQLAASRRRS